MSWNSPNYAKKKGGGSGGLPSQEVLDLVVANIQVPYYEPVMAESELVLTEEGDLVMNPVGYVPLELIP